MKQKIFNFLDYLVEQEYSESKEIYDFEKEELLSRISSQKSENRRQSLSKFGIPIESIPQYLGVVLATITTIIEIVKLRKDKAPEKEQVKLYWEGALIELNLEKDQVNKILEKYTEKMVSTISEIEEA